MTLNWKDALVIGVFVAMAPGVGLAHELTCDKTVNGVQRLELDQYPTNVEWRVRINNVHPDAPSVVESFRDRLIPFDFDPAPPFAIPVGGYVEDTVSSRIGDFMECLILAALDGRPDRYIDNTARVTWDLGEAQCSARVVCEYPAPPPPETEPTRTRGFYMTHIQTMSQCLAAGGPIELGDLATVATIEDAMGILWGSVPRFPDDTSRDQYERARFLLGVQTLVGICNVRLFAATPEPANLIDVALDLLELPYACTNDYLSQVSSTQEAMDEFNNSGDEEPFPPGFEPGPATPQAAQDLAEDPTTPDFVCSPVIVIP